VHTSEELLAKYRDLMEGISGLRFVAGFCYTQLTDIEQEINGLLTYDRRPKVAPHKIAEIHQSLFRLSETKEAAELEDAAVGESR
jgi:hypothetical protein